MQHRVYLVRHGQSEWNVLRLTQGQTAHPRLTELGQRQASEAAELIVADIAAEGGRVRRVLTSDLVRAVETAEVIARRLGAEIVPDPRLREQQLGRLEGRSYDETWAAAEDHDWSDPELPVAGGESPADVRRRMSGLLGELDPGETVVLVSHGDAIRYALTLLPGMAEMGEEWVEVPNGAVARVGSSISWLGSRSA